MGLRRQFLVFPVFIAAFVGCGASEDTLQSFTVNLVGLSDCEQVQQTPVACVDPAEISVVRQRVRWWLELLDDDIFMLYDDAGRALPGVRFRNNGTVLTGTCVGGGGDCLFARSTSTDDARLPGCVVTQQYVIDVLQVDDDLEGELVEIAYTDDQCSTLYLAERRVAIEGTRNEEQIPARERFAP
ncbi:MAG: hypothetical protein ACO3JL_04410 [Myxococcota bacterium]